MCGNTFKEMLEEYKKVVQIPFEEYKEQTKKDKKEVFQFMVHKMANDDIKLYESLEKHKEYIEMIEEELEKYKSIIKEVREYIMSELITEWDIKNGGHVSGSDLPVEVITPILKILDKENNNE